MQKLLHNLSLRKKMIVSHGTLGLLAMLVALIALTSIVLMLRNYTKFQEGPIASTEAVGSVLFYSSDIKGGITGVLSQSSNDYFDSFHEMMAADAEAIETAIQTLKTSLVYADSDEATALVENLDKSFTSGEAVRTKIMSAIQRGDFAQASNLYGMEYRVVIQDIQTTATELKVLVGESNNTLYHFCLKKANEAVMFIIVASVVCLFLGFLMTRVVSKCIRLPVQELMRISEEMKDGNLSVADSITYRSEDEMGRLAESMRETLNFLHGYVSEISRMLETIANGDLTMDSNRVTDFRGDFASIKVSLSYILDNLNSTLYDINLASQQVNSGAVQIASGAQTLAHGASEQTSSVERLSEAVSNITSQLNMTAEHSENAKQTMNATTHQVQACNEQMNHMMTAMDNITQQASQISKIVKTIEDIAFQTNILALNAAVEAARAGAAGKGFAVVADEVRNLAVKSAEASQSTSTLIGGTVDAVNNGTAILSETAKTLVHVVEGSRNSAALVEEIAQAAQNQASAVAEISHNIEQITGVVHTTSSTAEQSAAASEELSGQATTLNDLLHHFRLRIR